MIGIVILGVGGLGAAGLGVVGMEALKKPRNKPRPYAPQTYRAR